MSYFEELNRFINQSDEAESLKTSSYQKEYLGLKIKISFGQGMFAKIPWIAFFQDDDSISNGIYPVFLYFRKRNILILAYGISEAQTPERNWHITDVETIDNYFEKNNLEKAERYGSHQIFKTYYVRNLNPDIVNADLNNIIEIYKNTIPTTPLIDNEKFDLEDFIVTLPEAGLVFDSDFIIRYVSSLCTKPFVILTGLAGSGKTKLAQAFSAWICENETQQLIVPVGADWTNREPLLGYPNALNEGSYIRPENGTLDLILRAIDDPEKPYFLILDEMNLSHVERYFADFLSAMETGGEISLHAESERWSLERVPAKVILPRNLFIIGTVNIDETTYMFSPKVLDRASVIEFRVTTASMEAYLKEPKPLNMAALRNKGASLAHDFVHIAHNATLTIEKEMAQTVNETLLLFFKELKEANAEFGYRSATELLRFVAVLNKIDPSWTCDEIMDAAIMQKLLPKVHGSRRKLDPILRKLALLCLQKGNSMSMEEILSGKLANEQIIHPVSLEKICRMYKSLIENGFTSYAEA